MVMKRALLNKSKVILIFFIAALICKSLSGQEKSPMLFKSIIVDSSFSPIEGVVIKSLKTGVSTTSDATGFFSLQTYLKDTLIIHALGYELEIIRVSSLPEKNIILRQITHRLKQVEVFEFKDWSAFRKEFLELELKEEKVNISGLPAGIASQKPVNLRTNTFEEKPHFLNYIVSPFSSILYHTNKTDKSKRKVWAMMINENNESLYRSIIQKDSLQVFLNIPDSIVDDFILFCNINIQDKKSNSALYYKTELTKLYELFSNKKKGN